MSSRLFRKRTHRPWLPTCQSKKKKQLLVLFGGGSVLVALRRPRGTLGKRSTVGLGPATFSVAKYKINSWFSPPSLGTEQSQPFTKPEALRNAVGEKRRSHDPACPRARTNQVIRVRFTQRKRRSFQLPCLVTSCTE